MHIGVDSKSGLPHTAGVTTAKVHVIKGVNHLLREDDRDVYGDKAYQSTEIKALAEKNGVAWNVNTKKPRDRERTEEEKAFQKSLSQVRSKVEHVFRVIKCQFGFWKVRFKGLAKNANHMLGLVALAGFYLARNGASPKAGVAQ